jgi:acetyl esterase/lipase
VSSDPVLPDLTLRYAGHADGVVDLHLPAASDSSRVVVLLHGGFWKTAYDRAHVRPLARALADDGFVVASPEYRRVGPGGAGGWPTTGRDVVDAVEALPRLLGQLGVRPTGIEAVGHSAGGHLALWLATAAPLDRVVALAPVCDLHEATRRGLGSDAARAFLGEIDPDEADPMLLLDDRPDTAITVLHGTRDDTVPIDLSRGLVDRHPWIELVELDADHYEVIEPTGPPYDALRAALRR